MRCLNQASLKVSAQLGQDITAVQTGASYPLQILRQDSCNPILLAADMNNPVVFQYNDPKYGFELPPASLLWIKFSNNKVIEIQINPQLGLLNLTDSILLIKHLCQLFDKAGWLAADQSHYLLIEQLAELYKDGDDNRFILQTWQLAQQKIVLRFKREAVAKEFKQQAAEAYYLITLDINADAYR